MPASSGGSGSGHPGMRQPIRPNAGGRRLWLLRGVPVAGAGERAGAGGCRGRVIRGVVPAAVFGNGLPASGSAGEEPGPDRMFFQILGAIAEFEHALMSERTMDGLEAARARGRAGGQKPKLGSRQVAVARQMYEEVAQDGKRRYTVQQVADEFGVTRPTIYRHLGSDRADPGPAPAPPPERGFTRDALP